MIAEHKKLLRAIEEAQAQATKLSEQGEEMTSILVPLRQAREVCRSRVSYYTSPTEPEAKPKAE